MKNYTQNLESELDSKLHFITLENQKNIVQAELSMNESLFILEKLKKFIIKYKFQSEGEEIEFFNPTSEGYYDVIGSRYVYNYTDHLGNVRLSYYRNGTVAAILEENNYYPFGLKHEGYNSVSTATPSYKYKYNGKELQETGMYAMDFRHYMPDVGRFMGMDALSEA